MKSEEKRVEDINITLVTQNVQCPDLIPYNSELKIELKERINCFGETVDLIW